MDYCPECNAVESVIRRFEDGESISIEDCRKLPRVMFFDRANDNPAEYGYAIKFKKIIEDYERELLQDPLKEHKENNTEYGECVHGRC